MTRGVEDVFAGILAVEVGTCEVLCLWRALASDGHTFLFVAVGASRSCATDVVLIHAPRLPSFPRPTQNQQKTSNSKKQAEQVSPKRFAVALWNSRVDEGSSSLAADRRLRLPEQLISPGYTADRGCCEVGPTSAEICAASPRDRSKLRAAWRYRNFASALEPPPGSTRRPGNSHPGEHIFQSAGEGVAAQVWARTVGGVARAIWFSAT